MAIVKEFFEVREDGVVLNRTYSDSGLRIRQVETGLVFDDAVDVEFNNFTYEETEERVFEYQINTL